MPEPAAGATTPRIAYLLKRYPRLSETFIVNEILALEAAGANVDIFAAKDPGETIVHPAVGRVRAGVSYTHAAARQVPALHRNDAWPDADDSDRVDVLRAEIEPAGPEAEKELSQALFIADSLRLRPVDHIHAHFATTAARVARLVSRLTGTPFSFTAHAKDIFTEEVDWGTVGCLLRDAAFTVAISDYHARFLASREPAARLVVVRNGIDVDDFVPATRRESVPGLILAVGRLVEKKGFIHLVDACDVLHERGVSFRCRLIGDGPEREALEKRAGDAGLADNIEFCGARDQEAVREALAEATLLAAPCVEAANGDRDGLPTVLLEAMAGGVPVVSTPVTGIPELVVPERTGILVNPGDARSLAAAIERLLGNRFLRCGLAAAGRRRVVEQHNHLENGRRLLAVMSGRRACA